MGQKQLQHGHSSEQSLRKASLAKVFDNPVSQRQAAIRLELGMMANPEMGACRQKEPGPITRFLQLAEPRQDRRQ